MTINRRDFLRNVGIASAATATACAYDPRTPTEQIAKSAEGIFTASYRVASIGALGMAGAEPLNEDGERGVIIMTSSAASQDGQIGQVAYTASKAGVVGITLVVARDLSNEGIRCNTILPGIFDTPLLARAPDNVKAALAASVPFPKRLGRPEEYAQVAHTMITCGYLNGEDVRVDGAIRMAPR